MSQKPRRSSPSKRPDRSGPAPRSKPAPASSPGAIPPDDLAPGLYLVATPIGNLGDIGARALRVLASAGLIACEDTRRTRKLMNAYGLGTPLSTYHEHNAARARPGLIARMKAGGAVALVSDAGTPLISDPGYKLVQAAIAEDLNVVAVPGASAPLAALMISGLPSDRFLFAGFLPSRSEARRRALNELNTVPATLIFFEAPRRLAASLSDMCQSLGARNAAVAREITKLHEEVRRGSLAELATHYAEVGPPKGELVIVVGPAEEAASIPSDDEIDAHLRAALGAGASVRDAVTNVTAATKASRQKVYAQALAIAGQRGSGSDE